MSKRFIGALTVVAAFVVGAFFFAPTARAEYLLSCSENDNSNFATISSPTFTNDSPPKVTLTFDLAGCARPGKDNCFLWQQGYSYYSKPLGVSGIFATCSDSHFSQSFSVPASGFLKFTLAQRLFQTFHNLASATVDVRNRNLAPGQCQYNYDCKQSKGEICNNSGAGTTGTCGQPETHPSGPKTCDPSKTGVQNECGIGKFCKTTDAQNPDPAKRGTCVENTEVVTNQDTGGLVPCTTNCGFCDLFTMVNRILKKMYLEIIPAITILIVVAGGYMLLTAGGKEEQAQKARSMIGNVIVGLAIMYTAWLLVHSTLSIFVGSTSSVRDIVFPWYDVQCNLAGPGAEHSTNTQNPSPSLPATNP